MSDTAFLQGGGELGARTRAHDWSSTPLGPPERWPQSLRSALSILLPSKAQIILFWGPDFTVFYNDAYRPVFGAKHPRMLGQPGRVAWREIWDGILHPLLSGVVQTGEAFWASDRLFVLERNGFLEETYFDVSYDPVRDESGRVGGVFCIVSETTGRVVSGRRVRALRDLGARLGAARSEQEAGAATMESLASSMHDIPFALLFQPARGQRPAARFWTPGAESLAEAARWPLLEAQRSSTMRLVQLDAKTRIRAPLGAWDRPPTQAVVMPLPGETPGATIGTLVFGLNPLRAFDEDFRGFADLLARQVATGFSRSRAQEEERRRAEALARLDRAKTIFFNNVSHEFRTPLTLMLGPLEETLEGGRLADDDRRHVATAHRNAVRLQKLVNTLLEFSRIEAGRIEARYEPTDLAALTAELASAFRAAMEKGGLRFSVQCPPLGTPVHVDHGMWERIVFNLLSNAYKYTLAGEVAVTLIHGGDHVELSVRDTGTGIPADALPHLFERFYRVRGAAGRSIEGTGIGLALVQELVRLHGGLIEVASEAGRGTTFTVSIPLGTAHLPPERVVDVRRDAPRISRDVSELLGWLPSELEPGPAGEVGTRAGDRARVLLADDNADMRDYVARLLADTYDVEAVADGGSALRAARERRPDLLLTDVMMPALDGFGLVDALRADEELRGIPVILLSARAGDEARLEGIASGADDYLVKPFGARELLARVEARLKLSRMREAAVKP